MGTHHCWSQLGPLGRVGLVVTKSVCVCVCVSPSHAIFCVVGLVQSVPCLWTGAERALSVDWCGSCLALAISIFGRALRTGMCSGGVNRVSIFDLDLDLDFNLDLDLE